MILEGLGTTTEPQELSNILGSTKFILSEVSKVKRSLHNDLQDVVEDQDDFEEYAWWQECNIQALVEERAKQEIAMYGNLLDFYTDFLGYRVDQALVELGFDVQRYADIVLEENGPLQYTRGTGIIEDNSIVVVALR